MILWTIVAMYLGRSFFPVQIEAPPEVLKPTQHELMELAQEIAKPEIQKAKELWENKPPRVIKEQVIVNVPGKESTVYVTKKIYPKSSVAIRKDFLWNFNFPNDGRASDSLSFTVTDSLVVTAYEDTSGVSYIGQSEYNQTVNDLKLSVHPKIYRAEIITPVSVFAKLGYKMSEYQNLEVASDPTVRKLIINTELGFLVNERWYLGANASVGDGYSAIGVNVGTRLFKIGG